MTACVVMDAPWRSVRDYVPRWGGVRSFAVQMKSPADVAGNLLNDVARAFPCSAPVSGAEEARTP